MSRKAEKPEETKEKVERIEIKTLGRMMGISQIFINGIIREEKMDPNKKLTSIELEKLKKKHYGVL